MAILQKGSLIGFLPRKPKTAARRLQSGACKNIFMNSISVENFVGCFQSPLGSRVVRKVVEDHLAVAGDTRRGQGHRTGTRGDAQGAAISAQQGHESDLKIQTMVIRPGTPRDALVNRQDQQAGSPEFSVSVHCYSQCETSLPLCSPRNIHHIKKLWH